MKINSQFRRLNDQEIKEYIKLGGLAYPFMNLHTPEDLQKQTDRFIKMQNEYPGTQLYGAYREDSLVGGMQLHDFVMNYDGVQLEAGGVGFVAVDLLHKKERVAKDIISYFVEHYRQRKVALAMLYPFRPDFYKQMGFGFGTKMNQYRIKPSTLPRAELGEGISYLNEQDKEELVACYNRFAAKTHGMLQRTKVEISNIFSPGKTTVVCKRGEKIAGYLSFFFKKVGELNPMKNDILVKELIYEDLEVFRQLLGFLHVQFDQINRIIINTQDEDFHYLLTDPRDESDNNFAPVYHQSNLQGVGIMYRIIDIEEFFRQVKQHSFGNVNMKLKLNIADTFVEDNNKPVMIEFKDGMAELSEEDSYDAEITMDISDFSAMVMGCVEFRALLRLGLAQISDQNCAAQVNELFRMKDKPICTTVF